jgi:hypothetical protein
MEAIDADFRTDATHTHYLLRCGLIAGPFYLAVGLTQALLRNGFDLSRHPLSLLANGPGGWIQTANFVLTGLMVLAAAVGFRRIPERLPRGMTYFLGAFGVAMIVAAVFPADPVDGFPPGTPKGPPTSITTTGLVHFAAGGLGFLSLGISCLIAAWAMWRRKVSYLALISLFSGLAVLVGFFGGIMSPIGVAGIWFAVVVGWAWLAILSLRLNTLRREVSDAH